MKRKLKKVIFNLFTFTMVMVSILTTYNVKMLNALGSESSDLVEKVSNDFTRKFCNSIAFGLSKESAINFSIEENKKVFEKRKNISMISREEVAKEIAYKVIDSCGYPINLSGEKGVKEFATYYLSKYQESLNRNL